MKRKIVIVWLMLSLLLFTAHAGAEAPIVVNPDCAPGTSEETCAMVDAVVKKVMENDEKNRNLRMKTQ